MSDKYKVGSKVKIISGSEPSTIGLIGVITEILQNKVYDCTVSHDAYCNELFTFNNLELIKDEVVLPQASDLHQGFGEKLNGTEIGEIHKDEFDTRCKCDIHDLMNYGCKCGGK